MSTAETDERRRQNKDLALGAGWQGGVLLLFIALTGVSTMMMAGTLAQTPARVSFPAIAILTGVAALTVGLILGFLFGVPRARISVTTPAPQPGSAQGGGPSARAVIQETSSLNPYGNVPNTNLEQISDWLTKIIVGISIVQAAR